MKSFRSILAALALVAVCLAGAGLAPAQDAGKLYTKCNIWHEESEISSINYKKGAIIAAGTEVKDVKAIEKGKLRKVQFLQFTLAKDGATFAIEFEPKYNPGMTVHDLKDRFFSEKDFAALTKGFTATEIDCIKKGILKEGMSKAAVLVAYGTPPPHKTPSLESNVWTYWRARMAEKKVYFDDKGKTQGGKTVEEGQI